MEALMFSFALACLIQVTHSLEEIFTHFETYWPLWRMKRSHFIAFEIGFTILFLSALFLNFPLKEVIAKLFLMAMFANGVWHIFWAWSEKRYVPGLVTAPLHIINFSFYFLQLHY